jgi:hypothetical protein
MMEANRIIYYMEKERNGTGIKTVPLLFLSRIVSICPLTQIYIVQMRQ